jgi:hypothetical protein
VKFSAGNFFPRKILHVAEIFPSRRISPPAAETTAWPFSEGKPGPRVIRFPFWCKSWEPNSLSTQKVTENLQIAPEFNLTDPKPIPISCGQGSGHPHPVVVDNVSGSFGNLVSPWLFDRR